MTNQRDIQRDSSPVVWKPGHTPCILRSNEVHVWIASLDISEGQYYILRDTLSDEELERAARFRFEKDRKRFTSARGILRSLLSGYLDTDANKISISYGRYGKPQLSPGSSAIPVHFNLAHAHSRALFAFALDRDVGVDIEFMRRDVAQDDIAERFFSPHEKAALDSLPPDMKRKGFFTCWSRKEAFLKATGKGLSFGLDRVEVTVNPESPASVLSIGGSKEDAAGWSLQDIPADEDYSAALAVKGHGFNLCLREWRSKGAHHQ